MTDAIIKANQSMPVKSMSDATQLAKAFAQAHVMGAQNDPEGMLVVALIREIGLVRAESTYHIMQGRISKKASAILSDFVKAGGSYEILQRDADGARVKASYGRNVDVEFSFTWEDAMQEPFIYSGGEKDQFAELKKPFDQRKLRAKYRTPRSRAQMLWARLVSDMCTALCPEARDGMYPPEVVGDFEPEPKSEPKPIDVQEASSRLDENYKSEKIDYTVCPFDGKYKGSPWEEFTTEQLERCLDKAPDGLTATHAAAVRLVLENRKDEK